MNWNENQLSLGKPRCMDTPTLIEWIQRQLETEEETHERHLELGLNDEVTEVFVHGQSDPIVTYRNGGIIYTPRSAPITQTEANDIKARLTKDKQGRFIESQARYLGLSETLNNMGY